MGYNPRQLKRFVNNLNLRHGLMRSSGVSIAFDAVLHWGIIEHVFPLLADDLEDNPNNLFTLKGHLDELSEKIGLQKVWEADDQLLKALNVGQSLHKYIRNEQIVSILNSFKIEKEDFTRLLTFSASVESEEAIKLIEASPRTGQLSETMVEIPAGPFRFGEKPDEVGIDHPYLIDIYPVTNARFKVFIENEGYETEKWWTEQGWQWREKNRVLRPEYWDDSKFNASDHPVVGVSWHEAAAFCNWLSEAGKDGFNYCLPSEKQWERAARGIDGRIYPWGTEFDKDRCNTKESGEGRSSRVDRYANGVSPVGCYDMAGNVWEWVTDFYEADQNTIAVKGGSWYNPAEDSRCAERHFFHPSGRDSNVGFRCARALK
jgi:iron(II)-dependent oxidoreductase